MLTHPPDLARSSPPPHTDAPLEPCCSCGHTRGVHRDAPELEQRAIFGGSCMALVATGRRELRRCACVGFLAHRDSRAS